MRDQAAGRAEKKALRSFGLTVGAALVGLLGLAWPWLLDRPYPFWPWPVGALFCLTALVAPTALRRVRRAWLRIGRLLGWINSQVILGVVFYALVVPIGAMMRLVVPDPMSRRFEDDSPSYRKPSARRERDHFERPF